MEGVTAATWVFSVAAFAVAILCPIWRYFRRGRIHLPLTWLVLLHLSDCSNAILSLGLVLKLVHRNITTCKISSFFIHFGLLDAVCTLLASNVIFLFVESTRKSSVPRKPSYYSCVLAVIVIPQKGVELLLSVVPCLSKELFNNADRYLVTCVPFRTFAESGHDFTIFAYVIIWSALIISTIFITANTIVTSVVRHNQINTACNMEQDSRKTYGKIALVTTFVDHVIWTSTAVLMTSYYFSASVRESVSDDVLPLLLSLAPFLSGCHSMAKNVLFGRVGGEEKKDSTYRSLKKLELIDTKPNGVTYLKASWQSGGVTLSGLMKVYSPGHVSSWSREMVTLGVTHTSPHPHVGACLWTRGDNPYHESMSLITGAVVSPQSKITCSEWANLGSLRSLLREIPNVMSDVTVCGMARDIADGLSHLHRLSILHNNLDTFTIRVHGDLQTMTFKPIIGDFQHSQIIAKNHNSSLDNLDSFHDATNDTTEDIRSLALVIIEILVSNGKVRQNQTSTMLSPDKIAIQPFVLLEDVIERKQVSNGSLDLVEDSSVVEQNSNNNNCSRLSDNSAYASDFSTETVKQSMVLDVKCLPDVVKEGVQSKMSQRKEQRLPTNDSVHRKRSNVGDSLNVDDHIIKMAQNSELVTNSTIGNDNHFRKPNINQKNIQTHNISSLQCNNSIRSTRSYQDTNKSIETPRHTHKHMTQTDLKAVQNHQNIHSTKLTNTSHGMEEKTVGLFTVAPGHNVLETDLDTYSVNVIKSNSISRLESLKEKQYNSESKASHEKNRSKARNNMNKLLMKNNKMVHSFNRGIQNGFSRHNSSVTNCRNESFKSVNSQFIENSSTKNHTSSNTDHKQINRSPQIPPPSYPEINVSRNSSIISAKLVSEQLAKSNKKRSKLTLQSTLTAYDVMKQKQLLKAREVHQHQPADVLTGVTYKHDQHSINRHDSSIMSSYDKDLFFQNLNKNSWTTQQTHPSRDILTRSFNSEISGMSSDMDQRNLSANNSFVNVSPVSTRKKDFLKVETTDPCKNSFSGDSYKNLCDLEYGLGLPSARNTKTTSRKCNDILSPNCQPNNPPISTRHNVRASVELDKEIASYFPQRSSSYDDDSDIIVPGSLSDETDSNRISVTVKPSKNYSSVDNINKSRKEERGSSRNDESFTRFAQLSPEHLSNNTFRPIQIPTDLSSICKPPQKNDLQQSDLLTMLSESDKKFGEYEIGTNNRIESKPKSTNSFSSITSRHHRQQHRQQPQQKHNVETDVLKDITDDCSTFQNSTNSKENLNNSIHVFKTRLTENKPLALDTKENVLELLSFSDNENDNSFNISAISCSKFPMNTKQVSQSICSSKHLDVCRDLSTRLDCVLYNDLIPPTKENLSQLGDRLKCFEMTNTEKKLFSLAATCWTKPTPPSIGQILRHLNDIANQTNNEL